MNEGLLDKIRNAVDYARAYTDGEKDGYAAGHSEGWELGFNDATIDRFKERSS